MIFAAGLGTRLKPLTDNTPKALLPIGGKPLIEHIILKLKSSGFDEIIINVHHFADQIIDFVVKKNNFDIHIHFSDERDMLLETGGGIKKAADFFNNGKSFLVHNVDILSNINLNELYQHHVAQNLIATLLVSNRTSSRYLLFDKNLLLKGWVNEKTGEIKPPIKDLNPDLYKKFAFSGIHVISPEIFNLMNDWEGKFSIIDFYLSICDKEKVKGYNSANLKLIDVGKLDSLEKAEKLSLEI